MKATPDTVWTQEAFFPWAEAQDLPYEFDGNRPVAMLLATLGHSRISRNVVTALNARLHGGPCEVLGFNIGVETVGKAVRYPYALVTCSKAENAVRLAPAWSSSSRWRARRAPAPTGTPRSANMPRCPRSAAMSSSIRPVTPS